MKPLETVSLTPSLKRYLKKRALTLKTVRYQPSAEPLAQWAEHRIVLEGRPFSFEGHEYLRGPYNDTAPYVVLMKGAQVGGTVWGILRAVHACLNGQNVMYLFPTAGGMGDFSKSRVGPLIAENPFLANMMTDTDTVGLKRIAENFLYLRGMKSSVGLKSVPVDMVIFDELDEATPLAKAMAKERLSHSL